MHYWYDQYLNLPYKHLGNDPISGIDCFNLCKLIYKEQLNIDIPYTTSDFCQNLDEKGWYQGITDYPIEKAATEQYGWIRISEGKNGWSETLQLFDLVLMKIGSTECVNHCSIVVDVEGRYKKLLHTMIDNPNGSWVAPYRLVYEGKTEIVCRWKNLKN